MKSFVMFDLDGTLTESAEGILKSVRHTLETFGIREEDPENLRRFIGPPLFYAFNTFYGFSPDKADEAVRIYRERYNAVGLFEAAVYPGVPEMLEKLTKAGAVCAMVTSKPLVTALRVVEHFDLKKYLTVCVGPGFGRSDETKAELIRRALSEGGVTDLSAAVMVGDRRYDMEGAAGAGVMGIGAVYGYGTEEELLSSGAARLARRAEDVARICLEEA